MIEANNTLINLKALGIYGDDNKVIGNKLVDTLIRIYSGDTRFSDMPLRNSDGSHKYQGGHPAAKNTHVVGNEFSGGYIGLGRKGTGKITYPKTYPAENTLLALNKGAKVVNEGSVKGTITRSSYSGYIGKPIQLKPSQVGPNAPDPVCDGVVDIASLPPKSLKIIAAHPE